MPTLALDLLPDKHNILRQHVCLVLLSFLLTTYALVMSGAAGPTASLRLLTRTDPFVAENHSFSQYGIVFAHPQCAAFSLDLSPDPAKYKAGRGFFIIYTFLLLQVSGEGSGDLGICPPTTSLSRCGYTRTISVTSVFNCFPMDTLLGNLESTCNELLFLE